MWPVGIIVEKYYNFKRKVQVNENVFKNQVIRDKRDASGCNNKVESQFSEEKTDIPLKNSFSLLEINNS
jgi:hypothetical protein